MLSTNGLDVYILCTSIWPLHKIFLVAIWLPQSPSANLVLFWFGLVQSHRRKNVSRNGYPPNCMYYSLNNWIGEHEITKLKKRYLLRIQKKRTQKQRQKDMNEMEWHKMDHLTFSAMRMRKRHLFCTSSHHNVPYEKTTRARQGF